MPLVFRRKRSRWIRRGLDGHGRWLGGEAGKPESRKAKRGSWLEFVPYVLPRSIRRICWDTRAVISTKRLDEINLTNLSGRRANPPTLFTRIVTFNPSNLFPIPSKSIPTLLASSRKYFTSWIFPVPFDSTLWISSITFLSFFSFLPCKMRLNPLL